MIENNLNSKLSPFVVRKKEIETNSKQYLKVPRRLVKPDRLIIEANDYLKTQKPSIGRFPIVLNPFSNILNIRVAPKNLKRALRIMDAFIKLVRSRNHEIITNQLETILVIDGIEFEISLKEKFRQVKTLSSLGTYNYELTGILSFRKESFNRKEWDDGKLLIEKKLADILAKLELDAVEEKEEKRVFDEIQRIAHEKEQSKLDLQKRRNDELEKFAKLREDANRWHQTKKIREYLDFVESNNDPSVESNKWMNWAREKADLEDQY